MTTYRIISGDSHFVAPPNMWAERIDKKFRCVHRETADTIRAEVPRAASLPVPTVTP